MNAVDSGARRELELLIAIAEGRPVTQRGLAQRLGIALGLTNLYLNRLVRKGYVKVTTIPSHRIKYLVTPRGLALKARLTYEYMQYSLRLYRQARQTLREALTPLALEGTKRIALYGTGEAAELAYLTLKELGLEPAGIFDGQSGMFLGQPIRSPRELAAGEYDRVVVATFDDPSPHFAELIGLGLPPETLIALGVAQASGTSDGRGAGISRRGSFNN